MTMIDNVLNEIEEIQGLHVYGEVAGVQGLMVELTGIERRLSIGSRVTIKARDGRPVRSEVVGFKGGRAQSMPYGSLDGVGLGCRAEVSEGEGFVRPDARWLGRVVNALGEPIDGQGPLPIGPEAYRIRSDPPPAHNRRRVGNKLDLGVRAINTFITCCQGQRMGIFAGSGVGKSILLSMFARFTSADVIVIGLVGERGREVQEFLEDDLGPEGLARSVVVVATSDEPPLMRRQAAYMTLAISEYFRDRGHRVLCLMDSVTRFAMALREIGLSAGEPPANKGYTPSVLLNCHVCWSVQDLGLKMAVSQVFSLFWSRVMTITSQYPMLCVVFWMAILCLKGQLPIAVAILRSIFYALYRVCCQMRILIMKMLW